MGIGIIGCGAISRMHIDAYANIPGTPLRAVSDSDPVLAEKTGNAYGVPYYTDYHEMLCRDDLHIISICTPSGLHGEAAIAAAKAHKHVAVEKPMEVTADKIENIIHACTESGVKLTCVYNSRYHESNRLIKRAADNGRFGAIISANAIIRWYREPDYYKNSSWRGTWALDGGGALMNQSIHYIDLLQWFAGDAASVYAKTGNLLHKYIEAEDTAAAVIRFKSGALGTVTAGTSVYPGYAAEIQISGEHGSVCVRDSVITAWDFRESHEIDSEAAFLMNKQINNNRASNPMAFNYESHKMLLEKFVSAVREDTEPEITGEEAAKSVKIVLAAYQSARENIEILL